MAALMLMLSSRLISSSTRGVMLREDSLQLSWELTHSVVLKLRTPDTKVRGVKLQDSSTTTITNRCSPEVGDQIDQLKEMTRETNGKQLTVVKRVV